METCVMVESLSDS